MRIKSLLDLISGKSSMLGLKMRIVNDVSGRARDLSQRVMVATQSRNKCQSNCFIIDAGKFNTCASCGNRRAKIGSHPSQIAIFSNLSVDSSSNRNTALREWCPLHDSEFFVEDVMKMGWASWVLLLSVGDGVTRNKFQEAEPTWGDAARPLRVEA